MQAKNPFGKYKEDLQFQIPLNKSQSIVLDFLKLNLSLYLKQHDANLREEDDISQAIVIFLERQSRQGKSDFIFCFQYKYLGSKRSVDIGVVPQGSFEAFFVIEAKRLPSTKTKDYVMGNTGGIERFKKGHHGKGLVVSAMLGYIQKESFEYWHNKVNIWIADLKTGLNDELEWCGKDHLRSIKSNSEMSLFQSDHSRSKQKSIALYHFWLNMVTE